MEKGAAALVLASESPRRRQLLEQIGIQPAVIVASAIDETPHKKELPAQYAERMAQSKVNAVALHYPGYFVLAADTVVGCGRRILPKAHNREEVRYCLRLLSGRSHRVWCAVALSTPAGKVIQRCVMTRVTFKVLSQEEIEVYSGLDEGIGKAGGYAVQGKAGVFVRRINGSYTGVVGLPLHETYSLLLGNGYPL